MADNSSGGPNIDSTGSGDGPIPNVDLAYNTVSQDDSGVQSQGDSSTPLFSSSGIAGYSWLTIGLVALAGFVVIRLLKAA